MKMTTLGANHTKKILSVKSADTAGISTCISLFSTSRWMRVHRDGMMLDPKFTIVTTVVYDSSTGELTHSDDPNPYLLETYPHHRVEITNEEYEEYEKIISGDNLMAINYLIKEKLKRWIL